MSRGCVEVDEPSFQYECYVGVPHVGDVIEPSAKIDGCIMYGLHRMIDGRNRSSSSSFVSQT